LVLGSLATSIKACWEDVNFHQRTTTAAQSRDTSPQPPSQTHRQHRDPKGSRESRAHSLGVNVVSPFNYKPWPGVIWTRVREGARTRGSVNVLQDLPIDELSLVDAGIAQDLDGTGSISADILIYLEPVFDFVRCRSA